MQIDKLTAKGALKEIGIAKFVVPSMALQVVDRAMQAFGAEGISQDTPLAYFWAALRTLRYADVSVFLCSASHLDPSHPPTPPHLPDLLLIPPIPQGPDEVHIQQIGKKEAKRIHEIRAMTSRIQAQEKTLLASHKAKL